MQLIWHFIVQFSLCNSLTTFICAYTVNQDLWIRLFWEWSIRFAATTFSLIKLSNRRNRRMHTVRQRDHVWVYMHTSLETYDSPRKNAPIRLKLKLPFSFQLHLLRITSNHIFPSLVWDNSHTNIFHDGRTLDYKKVKITNC